MAQAYKRCSGNGGMNEPPTQVLSAQLRYVQSLPWPTRLYWICPVGPSTRLPLPFSLAHCTHFCLVCSFCPCVSPCLGPWSRISPLSLCLVSPLRIVLSWPFSFWLRYPWLPPAHLLVTLCFLLLDGCSVPSSVPFFFYHATWLVGS